MNILNEYNHDWEDSLEKTGEGLKKAWNILRNPSYYKYQALQFAKTIQHPNINYDIDSNKRTICLIPGLSASVPAYARLLSEITKDGKFNVLKLEDFPEDFRAIYSRLSLTERAELLLDTLDKINIPWPVDLIGHSIGGPVAVYAKILEEERNGDATRFWKVVTLSAPFGSKWLSKLPILPWWFRSLKELDPDSDFIQKLRDKWVVDHRFITQLDELITPEEMEFHNWQEHLLNHGHFDYMLGTPEIIADTASQIVKVLDAK